MPDTSALKDALKRLNNRTGGVRNFYYDQRCFALVQNCILYIFCWVEWCKDCSRSIGHAKLSLGIYVQLWAWVWSSFV